MLSVFGSEFHVKTKPQLSYKYQNYNSVNVRTKLTFKSNQEKVIQDLKIVHLLCRDWRRWIQQSSIANLLLVDKTLMLKLTIGLWFNIKRIFCKTGGLQYIAYYIYTFNPLASGYDIFVQLHYEFTLSLSLNVA